MGIWKRSVLAVSVALLAGACGTSASGPAAHTKAVPDQSARPARTVAPDTGRLTGGQPLRLKNSSLVDTSWVSATLGWALVTQPCATGTCTRLVRTADGGRHWQLMPEPAARVPDSTTDCTAQACVSQISFASRAIGYLYGPALLMTSDGGLTWHAQPGPQTETLTIAAGQVYRVTYTHGGCPGPCQPSLLAAPAGSARWRTVIGSLAEPGRSDSAQIAVSGPDVLVAMYGSLAGPVPAQAVVYRSADGGATWRQAGDPCDRRGPGGPSQEEDLIALAATPGGFFAGLCSLHTGNGAFVVSSTDRGRSWQTAGTLPNMQEAGLLAAASPTTLAVSTSTMSGSGAFTARMLVTTDGGRHWVTAAIDPQTLTTAGVAPAWLGFETPLAGQWLGDPHGVWTTADGGLHWTRTAVR